MMAGGKDMIRRAVEAVDGGSACCVVVKDGVTVSVSTARGIRPVLDAYDKGILSDAFVADKIIGRAAAMIMALGGVRSCYGATVSRGALVIFERYGVSVKYGVLTERIINRSGTGPCPMEDAVEGIDDPARALLAVRERLAELLQK